MNRKEGTALLAILLAIFGISYIPRKGTEAGAGAGGGPGSKPDGAAVELAAQQAKPAAACLEIAKRFRRFLASRDRFPPTCFPGSVPPPEFPGAELAKVHFVIALV